MQNAEAAKPKKRSAKQIAKILERGTKVLELRKNGASLRAISRELVRQAEEKGESTRGYSYEQVRKDFRDIVLLRVEEQQETLDEIRALSAERLEEILLHYMPYVRLKVGPDTSENEVKLKMKAGDTVLKAIKEYNELFGAKRPSKVEHSGAVTTYIMSKAEWEFEASKKLGQVNAQLEKFNDGEVDNPEDTD